MSDDKTREGSLGTLRSEFDDDETPSGVHPDFETLSGLMSTVRNAYMAYRLSPEQAATICAELRLLGNDGFEWSVGASSGAWYKRRTGEGSWSKSPMPINVSPVYAQAPSWLNEGIANRIMAAEKELKATAQNQEAPAEVAINPFQRKDMTDNPVVIPAGSKPRQTSRMGDDVDWLLEEWDSTTRTTSLPQNLPADLDADQAMLRALEDTPGPVGRQGENAAADGPVERGSGAGKPFNPEDFFLPPED
jgi:hypothetical protein